MKDKEEKLEKLKNKHEKIIKKQVEKEEKDKKDDMIKNLSDNLKELQDKLLYKDAEFQNFRKRKDEEVSRMLKYQNFDMALELLPIIDNFERAINNDKVNEDVKKYLEGFKIMYNNLINIMQKFEIKEIDCINKEFDHNICDALLTEHVDGTNSGIVIEVLQKGYMIKDKLLRPALVKVSE